MLSSLEELTAYRNTLPRELVPDIYERVLRDVQGSNHRAHRVESYYCPIVLEEPTPGDIGEKVIYEILKESLEEHIAAGTVALRYCTREEATHVGIASVGGSIVRVDKIERTHALIEVDEKFVSWQIERQNSRLGEPACCSAKR